MVFSGCLLQILTDEQQALQLAFSSLEEKYRKTFEEYNDIVKRWMQLKAKDADKMNEENDKFTHKKQDQLKQQLKEAAEEYKEVK